RGVLEAGQLDRRQALLGGGEHHVDACGRRELHHAHEGRVRLLVGGGRGGGDDRGRGAGVVGRVVGGAFGRVRVLGRVGPVRGGVRALGLSGGGLVGRLPQRRRQDHAARHVDDAVGEDVV